MDARCYPSPITGGWVKQKYIQLVGRYPIEYFVAIAWKRSLQAHLVEQGDLQCL